MSNDEDDDMNGNETSKFLNDDIDGGSINRIECMNLYFAIYITCKDK